jgi:thiol-disulfide isomerase/thioredoxin
LGKASRNKRTGSARDRIAAQREAQRKREVRNRLLLSSGAVVVVLAIVLALVIVKLNSNNNTKSGPATGTVLSASVLSGINVPASTLDAVGAGTTYPKSIISIPGSSLTSGGKPEVLYIGAEFCPYCATERWAMAVALSRFGTFSGLHGIHSSTKSTEPYPGTPTLTFYKTNYTSQYIKFTPVETETVAETTLQSTTSAQNQLISKYDAPPYVTGQAGSIPFVDFGGHYIISGASYNPQVLQGKTWSQVSAALGDSSSAIAKGADGTANWITAAICKLTNNQPGSACTSVVQSLETKL